MNDQYFYISKGNYLTQLAWYRSAFPNYVKALKKSDDPRINFMLGHCLVQLRKYKEALEHLRIAYEKVHYPEVALNLAIAEYEMGDFDRSRALIQELQTKADQLFLTKNRAYLKLRALLEKGVK